MVIFLLLFGLLATALSGSEKPVPQEQVSVYETKEITSHIASGRHLIAQLTASNPVVLSQYDLFVAQVVQDFSSEDIHQILKATSFAAYKHRLQKRKDADQTPYIIHPLGVAYNLLTIGKITNAQIIMGALLHDTVEDTQTTFGEIETFFGSTVCSYVREVTDDKSLSKQMRKQLQIEHAPHKSLGAASIKLGDKLFNLKSLLTNTPVGWEKERIDGYFTWAKSVVDALPPANASLKQEVDATIAQYWANQQ